MKVSFKERDLLLFSKNPHSSPTQPPGYFPFSDRTIHSTPLYFSLFFILSTLLSLLQGSLRCQSPNHLRISSRKPVRMAPRTIKILLLLEKKLRKSSSQLLWRDTAVCWQCGNSKVPTIQSEIFLILSPSLNRYKLEKEKKNKDKTFIITLYNIETL